MNESSEVDKLVDMATSGQTEAGGGYPFFEDAFELAEVLGLVPELIEGIHLYIEREFLGFTHKLKGSWDFGDNTAYNNTIFLQMKTHDKTREYRKSQREI